MKISNVTILEYTQAKNQEQKPLLEGDKCPICLEEFTPTSGLIAKVDACGTNYHAECLRKVSKGITGIIELDSGDKLFVVDNLKCPCCRASLLDVNSIRQEIRAVSRASLN